MATWSSAARPTNNWYEETEKEDKEASLQEEEEKEPAPAAAADGGSFDGHALLGAFGERCGSDIQARKAELPPSTETEVDPETGLKTIVEYKLNAKGQRVRVTKTIKVDSITRPVRKKVVERRTWRKFGHAAEKPRSDTFFGAGFTDEGVTYFPDLVFLDLTPKAKVVKKDATEEQGQKVGSVVVCRICGMTGDHWTLKCPNKEKIASGRMQPVGNAGQGGSSGGAPGDAPAGSSGIGGKYVPPSLRNQDGSRMMDTSMAQRDDSNTLRVSNLSEDTRESDLQELFRTFGPINRIYLAKDRETQCSRGFAFVTFVRREDAQRAMDRLAGYGYDHLILQIEWAKPSLPR